MPSWHWVLLLIFQTSLNLQRRKFFPEFGEDIQLDKPMPELGGLSIKDAIAAFTGEFLVSLTDVKMPDPSSMGGFPGGPDADPFGGNDAPRSQSIRRP